MDSIAALVVVAFLAFSGVEVMVGGIKVLLDASIEEEVLEKARGIAWDHPLVKDVVSVEGRNSGSYRFLELSLVPRDYDLRDAEKISADLKASICEEIDNVEEVLFDFSVERGESVPCATATDREGKLFTGRFAEAPCFELVEIDTSTGQVVSREHVDNPVPEDAVGRGARVAVFLARRGVEAFVSVEPKLEAGARGGSS